MNEMPEMPEKEEFEPYHAEAYERFLELLSMDYLYNWKALAYVLKVDPKTIYRWRHSDRAQEIVNKEIKRLISEMERAGKDDWRMFREKAKIMGVDDITKVEVVDTKDILDKLETDYDNLGRKAEGQVVAPDAPVQNQE